MNDVKQQEDGEATSTRTSVARVTDDWHVICFTRELGERPLARTLHGVPLVVYRDGHGAPHALLDRCPHRNAPLSMGRVVEGQLECRYHGWRFDGEGSCRFVPALVGTPEKRSRNVDAYPCWEAQGVVWIYGTPGSAPDREPFHFPHADDRRYTTVREVLDMEGTLHATAENALDVPHTAFLHRGLFRGAREPRDIEVVVRRWHDRVEAEYIGEPRPAGLLGRILAPSGGVVTHYDRFIMPCIAQVEYKLGDASHLCISVALTPVEAYRTRMFAVVSFRLPIPGWTVVPAIRPIAFSVLKQDAEVLRRQRDVIRHFGTERFASTELDALGSHILKLLRNAERGMREPPGEPREKHFTMRV